MFRNRNSSQKPPEELYTSFKASFPQLHATSQASAGPAHSSTSLTEALDVAVTSRCSQYGDEHDIKDLDPTPRANNEPWRFTPSLLDPNSFAFTNFANQPPGYYTPTPGGTNTLYHPQAGDLHTPGFSMGLGTPLSMPTSEGAVHAGQPTPAPFQAFTQQGLAPPIFQSQNPFGYQHPPPPSHHQPSFAPHQFSHHPPHFEPFEQHHDDGRPQEMAVDVEMREQPPAVPFQQQPMETAMRHAPAPPSLENFRYHVTLNAPTAMVKHAEEIPVTYLNKGQAYSIAIVDTHPAQLPAMSMSTQYRTYVRISFEDEQQRQRPGQCWQLWKEGRGTNEAHQRGGRLQAVEFVDPNQAGGLDTQMRPKIELESASFDGFSVLWSPAPNGPPECNIAVRFNFLSTDFSHSKGVKGIPVRLCSKTELKSTQAPMGPDGLKPEICYCKVKLFRDHGAERKLSNDIAHVKKTIDKLKQQIAQVEAGIKDSGKRKRNGSISKSSQASSRPSKVPKHKRTWSMSSASSTTGPRSSQEEDLQIKLQALQDMFTSTRPASVLFLKGDDLDDPDLHPVHLSGDMPELTRIDAGDSQMWDKQSTKTGASSMVSPTPSSMSIHSGSRRGSLFQRGSFNPPSHMSSNEWQNMSQTATGDLQGPHQHFSPPNVPVKVQRHGDPASLEGWIEALGVDYSYQPPPERLVKPIACFYVQPRLADKQSDDNYYRAVYLMQRTLKDLVNGIATKSNIEPTKVLRTIRVNKAGIEIMMEDESVIELPEGQDMVAEFTEMRPREPMQREWDTKPEEIQVDGEIDVSHTMQSEGFRLKLLY